VCVCKERRERWRDDITNLISSHTHTNTQPPNRNADGCLIVFDLTRRGTFENVSKWAEHAHTHTNNPHLVITLVGNKADCEEKRQVARAEAEALVCRYAHTHTFTHTYILYIFTHIHIHNYLGGTSRLSV
jgi:hypothetical protein